MQDIDLEFLLCVEKSWKSFCRLVQVSLQEYELHSKVVEKVFISDNLSAVSGLYELFNHLQITQEKKIPLWKATNIGNAEFKSLSLTTNAEEASKKC